MGRGLGRGLGNRLQVRDRREGGAWSSEAWPVDLTAPDVMFTLMVPARCCNGHSRCPALGEILVPCPCLGAEWRWACATVESGSLGRLGPGKTSPGVSKSDKSGTFFCVSPADRAFGRDTASSSRKKGLLSDLNQGLVSLHPTFWPGSCSQDDWQR